MILYTNGDSHTTAAEAVNSYCFANDDPRYRTMGRVAHPDNLKVSYGLHLARALGMNLMCEAESASSNDRIIRTTKRYLSRNGDPEFLVIGWSTWEREEWLRDGVYYQISAGGPGHDWPDAVKQEYKDWVNTVNYQHKLREQQEKIWDFHYYIRSIPHIFFNTYLPLSQTDQKDWGDSYVSPYDEKFTMTNWLLAQGFKTVNPNSYHFGPDGHKAWADFLMRLTKSKKESIMAT